MEEVVSLSGPAFGPTEGDTPQKLVILLHGYGADGQDLISLGPYFAQVLPDALFLSPNAPYPCGMGFGCQWYDIQVQDPDERLGQIREAARIIDGFIDRQLELLGFSDDRLALIGFSQGTMMSLFTALRRERACAGIMGYSGRLDSPELLEKEIRARPPVTLVHGDRDELLPVSKMDEAATALKGVEVEVETHVRPGLGHGIDEEGLRIGMAFLNGVFKI